MKKEIKTVMEMDIVYKPSPSILQSAKLSSSLTAHKFILPAFNPDTIACQEEFIVAYINRANYPLGVYKMGKGGMSGTVADIRLILSVALKCFASGIIVSHNHPSGTLQPSIQDKEITKQLKAACELMEIPLLDHIIVSPYKGYYSFADNGLL